MTSSIQRISDFYVTKTQNHAKCLWMLFGDVLYMESLISSEKLEDVPPLETMRIIRERVKRCKLTFEIIMKIRQSIGHA